MTLDEASNKPAGFRVFRELGQKLGAFEVGLLSSNRLLDGGETPLQNP